MVPISKCKRKYDSCMWLAVGVLAASLAAGGFFAPVAEAMEPGYHLPEWLEISFELDRVPEIGEPVGVIIRLTALVADLPGCDVTVRFPRGVKVVGSPPQWNCTLKKGVTTSLKTMVVCTKPVDRSSAVLAVKTIYPVQKLKVLVLRQYGSDDPEARELVNQLDELRGRYPVVRTLDFLVTAQEGFSGSAETGFGLYLENTSVPGDLGFVLKGSMFEVDVDKVDVGRTERQVANFRRLLSIVASRPAVAKKVFKTGGSMEAQLTEQAERLLFLGNKKLLAGNSGQAIELFEEANSLDTDPIREVASGNALAVALHLSNQEAEAVKLWRGILKEYPDYPLCRYVDYNVGIHYLLKGNRQLALVYFRNAFIRKTQFTLVKELILELE